MATYRAATGEAREHLWWLTPAEEARLVKQIVEHREVDAIEEKPGRGVAGGEEAEVLTRGERLAGRDRLRAGPGRAGTPPYGYLFGDNYSCRSRPAEVIVADQVSSPGVPTPPDDEADGLLRAIWNKRWPSVAAVMDSEVGRAVHITAAGNPVPGVGSDLRILWEIQAKYLERAIRTVATEFETRAPPAPVVRRYLLTRGILALAALAAAEALRARNRLGRPKRTEDLVASGDHLRRTALHLERVAETELRVVASAAKFAGEEPAAPSQTTTPTGGAAPGARAVLDTNVWLHGKRPDEVPWHQVLDIPVGEPIVLVVPSVVVRELDKHKTEHRQAHLRRRALERLQWLENVKQSGGRVREGVALATRLWEPQVDYRAEHLDSDVPDDRLLASALEVQREGGPGCPVVVVTIDVGPRLKAGTHGLKAVDLPEAYRLPSEPDPGQKRVQELEARLRSVEHRQPRLELTFPSGDLHAHLPAPPARHLSDGDRAVERAAAEARVREHFILPFGRTNDFTKTQTQFYLGAFDEHLEVVGHLRGLAARTVQVTLRLRNAGSAPATDIEVRLAVRNGPALLSVEPVPPDPKPPDLDQGNLAAHLMNMERQTLLKLVVARELAPGTPTLSVRPPKLNHFQDVDLPVFATFPAPDQARPFGLTFTVFCVEASELWRGELHVVVEPRPPGPEAPGQ